KLPKGMPFTRVFQPPCSMVANTGVILTISLPFQKVAVVGNIPPESKPQRRDNAYDDNGRGRGTRRQPKQPEQLPSKTQGQAHDYGRQRKSSEAEHHIG